MIKCWFSPSSDPLDHHLVYVDENSKYACYPYHPEYNPAMDIFLELAKFSLKTATVCTFCRMEASTGLPTFKPQLVGRKTFFKAITDECINVLKELTV